MIKEDKAMKKTVIEWHNPAEELPEKSGYYLICYERALGFAEVHYSSKHKLFNTRDNDTETEAQRCTFPVSYWAELPEIPEDESEDE
jgi:hypothetical protein